MTIIIAVIFNARADGRFSDNSQWNLGFGFNRTSLNSELSESSTSVPAPFVLELNAGHHQSESFYLRGKRQQYLEKSDVRIVQFYFTDFDRDDLELAYNYQVFDLDYQESRQLNGRHQLLWGGIFRYHKTEASPGPVIALAPADRSFNLSSMFIQDEIKFLDGRAKVIVGSKIEHHKFTGTEVMPNIRALWHYRDTHTVWMGVSRVIREPTPWNQDRNIFNLVSFNPQFIATPAGGRVSNEAIPGEDIDAENVITGELGFRGEASKNIVYDLSLFYLEFEDKVAGTSLEPAFQAAGTQATSVFITPYDRYVSARPPGNQSSFSSYGGELSLLVKLGYNSKLRFNYSYIYDNSEVEDNWTAPKHQYKLDASRRWSDQYAMTLQYRYVDGIEIGSGEIDRYQQLDLRLDWHITPDLSASIIGKHLLRADHMEWIVNPPIRPDALEMQRTGYLRLEYRF